MVGRVNTELMKILDIDADEETVTYTAALIEVELMQQINWLNTDFF